jgi:hypothetical protein
MEELVFTFFVEKCKYKRIQLEITNVEYFKRGTILRLNSRSNEH